MTDSPRPRPSQRTPSLAQHRATPVVYGGIVLALMVLIGILLDEGPLLNGHHGSATVLIVFGLPLVAALFLYDPMIRVLDRLMGRDG